MRGGVDRPGIVVSVRECEWRESLTGWLLSGLSALANNALGIAYIVVVAHRLSLSVCLSVCHSHSRRIDG